MVDNTRKKRHLQGHTKKKQNKRGHTDSLLANWVRLLHGAYAYRKTIVRRAADSMKAKRRKWNKSKTKVTPEKGKMASTDKKNTPG